MSDKKKKTTYSLGIVLLALAMGLVIGFMTAPKIKPKDVPNVTGISKLGSHIVALEYIIANYYVDDVEYDSLTTSAMTAMLESLDPHSSYLTPIDNSKETEMLHSRFEGIGVTLHSMNDSVFVSTLRSGSPAQRAGLRPGDRIIKVDTTVVSGTGMSEEPTDVVNLIRGPRFSTVTLGIQRQGSDKIKEFKVQRDVILHSTVLAAVMIDKHTGYVNISRFSETTASEFHAALLQLTKEGMTHLVLDLRGNRGGSLEAAISVADELLPKGDLIVYTEGAHSPRSNHYATRGGLFEEGKLTILINEFSASASEVVSGAIQDNDRGTIAGRRSFGKGLVQRPFDLPDGDAIHLTIARYYSPSGRCIQRPYDKGSDAYYMDYLTRIFSDYRSADSLYNATVDTTQTFLTKKGRKVYGGGGIQPDIILPYLIDTNWVYYNRLADKQVLEQVIFNELFVHYDQIIKKYPTAEAFVKNYQVDDATFERIIQCGESKGIPRHQSCIKKYGANIRNRYKALMAMTLYDDGAFYQVALPYDTEIQRALKKPLPSTVNTH